MSQPQPPPYYPPPQSHTERNIIIAILVIILVIVGVFAGLGLYYYASVNRSSILPQSYSTNIVNGLITVSAGGWNTYPFSVPTGSTNAYVSGSFYASGGYGNDIKVLVMDRTSYINWSNGHSVDVIYSSGYLTTSSFSVNLSAGNAYDLVYTNDNSLFSSKNVQTTVNLFYTA